MTNLRHAARRDENEPQIVDALRLAGCQVWRISGTPGLPDLLVSRSGQAWLVEVKRRRAQLTEPETAFWRSYTGPGGVVRTPEEALELIGDHPMQAGQPHATLEKPCAGIPHGATDIPWCKENLMVEKPCAR